MKIICYGDSNTWGFDPRTPFGDRYETAWPELLAQKTGWCVINQGENGREIPERPVAFPLDTDIAAIIVGTNDLLQSCTPEVICKKMEQFIKSLNLNRNKILLIAPPPMKLGEWVQSQRLIDDSVVLAKYYQALAHRLGVRFVDAGYWNIPLTFDGVHMTGEGHKAFADGLYDYLTLQCQTRKETAR